MYLCKTIQKTVKYFWIPDSPIFVYKSSDCDYSRQCMGIKYSLKQIVKISNKLLLPLPFGPIKILKSLFKLISIDFLKFFTFLIWSRCSFINPNFMQIAYFLLHITSEAMGTSSLRAIFLSWNDKGNASTSPQSACQPANEHKRVYMVVIYSWLSYIHCLIFSGSNLLPGI